MKRSQKLLKLFTGAGAVALVALSLACGSDGAVIPGPTSQVMPVLGKGEVGERYTAEIWVRGNVAYTTTWGNRSAPGNAIKIWDVTGNIPTIVDSVIVPNASTLGDVQASDDGQLLIVATEFSNGSIMIYSLADPLKPQLITRYSTALTAPGVHTAEVQRVNGKLYAFLCVDPTSGSAARLVIVDLSDPAAPTQVFTATMGSPFVHDVFVRDGILFTALWDAGVKIWDIGGAGSGTVANPVALGNVLTTGGEVHNIWWFHNGASGEKKYAFVGQEGPGAVGVASSGDIHVIDVSNFSAPREVAFYHLDGAGTHNFSVDESGGILYAAYYNGGVRAIDVTGDLSSCDAASKSPDGRCDLAKMGREVAHGLGDVGPVYVWGVQYTSGNLYASDMLNGIWKLHPAPFPAD
jgi:LVIVD repeat-containing protein